MINRQQLLTDLQSVLRNLEADLLDRTDSADVPEVGEWLRAEYQSAKDAGRTAQTQKAWMDDFITQVAAAWVLSCVFARFLEDNVLVDPPRIAGPGKRLDRARDEHTLFFQDSERAKLTDREYLLDIFARLAKLPAGKDVFGPHNPMNALPNWLGPDAAGELLRFFQKIDSDSGDLVHDFTDPDWDTRFLGDLYQDVSEAARKKYALLQTPEFVEEFILDRTLDPALDEFRLDAPAITDRDGKAFTESGFRMIDPACGSGHFLLGAFPRILGRWQKKDPGAKVRDLVQRALHSIHGVDVNPYAIAIARFRLLLAAIKACGITRLKDAPAFDLNLVCGDSLWHAPLRGTSKVTKGQREFTEFSPEADNVNEGERHTYFAEDAARITRLLREAQYHCVVANPPYIVPKDRALNQDYRNRYETCHRQYSLAVPFMERILRLAVQGRNGATSAGFTGQITANSFMKREFGKKLIESWFPSINLTHVIDTSGAYIPGHGTPTVILFARNQSPISDTIRTVMGIQGEPSTPDDPAHGQVWSAIVNQIDQPGSQSEFVSAGDSSRELFHKHPWSIGGGGAAELKEQLESDSVLHLESIIETISAGICITREDDAYLMGDEALARHRISTPYRIPSVQGDQVRDWFICGAGAALFPYDADLQPVAVSSAYAVHQFLWPARELLWRRRELGGDHKEMGRTWWEWNRFLTHRFRMPLGIAYGEIATHNHFVLDRGGKIFNRTAPVIKLPTELTTPDGGTRVVTEDDHLALLGLLNSSTACFWMKQVCHNKGSTVDQHGARQRTSPFEDFYAFNGTKLKAFPLPEDRPLSRTKQLDQVAAQLQATTPEAILKQGREDTKQNGSTALCNSAPLRESLSTAHAHYEQLRGQMVFLQEELDWECYRLYGLIDEDLTYKGDPIPLKFGERSFEILLASSIARGATAPTTWFERHNAKPITAPPQHWPEDYLGLYHQRHDVQQENASIALIEQPEYKRRWNTESWDSQVQKALKSWLLDRLESYFDFDGRMNDEEKPTATLDIGLTSVGQLADAARKDPQFLEVGEVYRDDAAFDVQRLVEELVQAEHVPLLPILRYKPPGLRKRQEWEHTWELQRQEDAIDVRTTLPKDDLEFLTEDQAKDLKQREVGDIPVPPKYKSSDFISSGGARYWSLRGKLDVPKERWISFPHCEGPDGTLVIAWAGYDHLQLARAISSYYVDVQERLGGRDDPRLVPLLACLIELLPWLKQWHNEVDPEFGVPMGDYFDGFLTEEARKMGVTAAEVRAWEPPKKTTKRKTKTKG